MDNRREPKSKKFENILEAVNKLSNVAGKRTSYSAGDVRVERIAGKYTEVDYRDKINVDNNQALFDAIGERIKHLRAQGFDYVVRDFNGRELLIKNHLRQSADKLDPIQTNESEIQFLRYLRGMLLIAQSSRFVAGSPGADPYQDISSRLEHVYAKYLTKKKHSANKSNAHGDSPVLTAELASDFANILKDTFGATDDKHAGMQLTIARDFASMLETHFDTCTIASEPKSKVATISITSMQRVSEELYAKTFANPAASDWMRSARAMQGLNPEEPCWLDFCIGERLKVLLQERNPIPPSARWLPLPATYFKDEKTTVFFDSDMQVHSAQTLHDQFVRTGIMIPFDVRKVPKQNDTQKYAYQKEIALDIAKDILRAQVPAQIEEFKQLYRIDDSVRFPFYVNYQTLLSPLLFEKGFGHTDNNARFVSMMDDVFDMLKRDAALLTELRGKHNVDLHLDHTNSAVNRNARFTTADKYVGLRMARLREAKQFLKDIVMRKSNTSELNGELQTRLRAIDALSQLLDYDSEGSYAKIPTYAKNIMMAALDHLVIGSQGVSIDGCKSCRDRTEVFSAAVKVMKENPVAMKDWTVLEKGIIKSLMQGHGFRSVGFHVAIVKAGLVHGNFKDGLRKDVQKAIKDFTPFSKALKEIDVEEIAELAVDSPSALNKSRAGMFSPGKSSSDPTPESKLGVQNRGERSGSAPTIGKRRGSGSGDK